MKFEILRQYLIPHHPVSRFMGWFTTRKTSWLKRWQIRKVIEKFDIDMSIAERSDPESYEHFQDFFTRYLKPGVRPLADADIVSPVDGSISQIGDVHGSKLIQAKGHDYQVGELLGGNPAHAALFENGAFSTIYLAPGDYHRIHMPVTGTLKEMIYVPGKLFSVNGLTASHVPNLFARNERVVCLFDTELGPMAMVLVGAMFVASMCTTWSGVVTPTRPRKVTQTRYQEPVVLNRGDEMGYFNFGSTVILLFGKDRIRWEDGCQAGAKVRMGQAIAQAADA